MRDEGGEREKVRLGWVRVLRTQEEARIGNWVRGERERKAEWKTIQGAAGGDPCERISAGVSCCCCCCGCCCCCCCCWRARSLCDCLCGWLKVGVIVLGRVMGLSCGCESCCCCCGSCCCCCGLCGRCCMGPNVGSFLGRPWRRGAVLMRVSASGL